MMPAHGNWIASCRDPSIGQCFDGICHLVLDKGLVVTGNTRSRNGPQIATSSVYGNWTDDQSQDMGAAARSRHIFDRPFGKQNGVVEP